MYEVKCDRLFKNMDSIGLLSDDAVTKWNRFIEHLWAEPDVSFEMVINSTIVRGPLISFPHFADEQTRLILDRDELFTNYAVVRDIFDCPTILFNIDTTCKSTFRENRKCPILFTNIHPDLNKVILNHIDLQEYHHTPYQRNDRNETLNPLLQLLLHIGIDTDDILIIIEEYNGDKMCETLSCLFNEFLSFNIQLHEEFDHLHRFFKFVNATSVTHSALHKSDLNPSTMDILMHSNDRLSFDPTLQIVKLGFGPWSHAFVVGDKIVTNYVISNQAIEGEPFVLGMKIESNGTLSIEVSTNQTMYGMAFPLIGCSDTVSTRPTVRLIATNASDITDYTQHPVLTWLFSIGCKPENIKLRYGF